MSVQEALCFIGELRNSPDQQRIDFCLKDAESLDEVAQMGLGFGYEFSVDELREAFRIDWSMRARYFSSRNT